MNNVAPNLGLPKSLGVTKMRLVFFRCRTDAAAAITHKN